jgi:hypothetical protein
MVSLQVVFVSKEYLYKFNDKSRLIIDKDIKFTGDKFFKTLKADFD